MKRVYALVLGVLGVLLAAVGFEIGDAWPYHLGQILGGVGTVGSLWALVLQYREGSPFEYPFTEASWKLRGPDQICVQIAGSEHGKGRNPSATIYEKDESTGRYEEVGCGVEVEPSGTVSILAARRARFAGKAVIR